MLESVFDAGKDEAVQVKKLKKENEDLVHQIGQLTVDINWLKKTAMISKETIKKLIDNADDLLICHQCELLGLARSTLYYTPSRSNDKDLSMMKYLDLLYFEDLTRGTRRMTRELKKKGYNVGRQHARSLMQIMRLKTFYCRSRTTIADPGKYKYPYLLRNLEIRKPNHVWALDITYVPMGRGYMYPLAIMMYMAGVLWDGACRIRWMQNGLLKCSEIPSSGTGSRRF